MNIAFVIYLIDIVHNIENLAEVALFISLLTIAIAVRIFVMEKNSYNVDENLVAIAQKSMKYASITASIAVLLMLFIPSKSTMGAMYVVPKVVNNETVQGISDNSLELLNELTKKWLHDAKEAYVNTKKKE